MKNIVIMASGNGSNAQAIIDHFREVGGVTVALILSNNPKAGVLNRAKREGVPAMAFNRYSLSRKRPQHKSTVEKLLETTAPDLIVLAGFMWKLPEQITSAHRVINIHPSLLPKHGGKGMYGIHVHRAAIASGDTLSGITIHHVNEEYDQGAVIHQEKTTIAPDETPESLSDKIKKLEHRHYPATIEKLLKR